MSVFGSNRFIFKLQSTWHTNLSRPPASSSLGQNSLLIKKVSFWLHFMKPDQVLASSSRDQRLQTEGPRIVCQCTQIVTARHSSCINPTNSWLQPLSEPIYNYCSCCRCTAHTLTLSAAVRPRWLGATSSHLNSSLDLVGASKTEPVEFAEAERKAWEEERQDQVRVGTIWREGQKESRGSQIVKIILRCHSMLLLQQQLYLIANSKLATDIQKSAAFPHLSFCAVSGACTAAVAAAAIQEV